MSFGGLDLLMFGVTCVCLLAGFPVAFTLAGTALIFALIAWSTGTFDLAFVGALPQRIFGIMTNEILVAVPLFIFMGTLLERSKIAEELLESMGILFGRLRGGLGISVSIVGALLAASTGIVGATVVTMGLLSLPTMLRRGYDPALSAGSIAAAGTLGQIIPPSIVLVLLGDVLSSAYQKSQLERGIFSPDTVSVGDLFAGALLPGLLLVGLYIAYQVVRAILDPKSSPPMQRPDDIRTADLMWRLLRALLPPLILIVAVLGSILKGIATPTEAAALGGIGALLLAGYRQPGNKHPVAAATVALIGVLILTATMDMRITRLRIPTADLFATVIAFILLALVAWGLITSIVKLRRNDILASACQSTAKITSMVFVILIGAAMFSLVFRGLGGDDTIHAVLNAMPGGVIGAMTLVMVIMFLLGFFLDFIEITFVVVPLVAPVLMSMGLDPVWIGIMMAVNLQTSFLTPPFGFALFYLRGVAPPEVSTQQIYRGVMPFIGIQILMLLILTLFPTLATWLPGIIFS